VIMLGLWAVALALVLAVPTFFAFFPPLSVVALFFMLSLYALIGFNTASALMRLVEKIPPPGEETLPAGANV
jgi:hypothetical protein